MLGTTAAPLGMGSRGSLTCSSSTTQRFSAAASTDRCTIAGLQWLLQTVLHLRGPHVSKGKSG